MGAGMISRLLTTAAKYGCDRLVRVAIALGVDAEMAIYMAAENGHLKVVQYLARNASLGPPRTAMAIATETGHIRIVKYLVAIGVPIMPAESLMRAADAGHLTVVRYLLASEYVPSVLYGWYAARAHSRGHLECARALTARDIATALKEFPNHHLVFQWHMWAGARAHGKRNLYFWWIPHCYRMRRRSGRRMGRRIFLEYRRCILEHK